MTDTNKDATQAVKLSGANERNSNMYADNDSIEIASTQVKSDLETAVVTSLSSTEGTKAALVVQAIWEGAYKEQVDALRGLINKHSNSTDAYKLALNSATLTLPTVSWSKAIDGTHSGLVGLSVIGTDDKTCEAIDNIAYTCVRYRNTDDTGYDVVVKVTANPVLDADTIQKQVEAYYTGAGLSIDTADRRKDNALLYSYDTALLCRPDSTPFVASLQYALADIPANDDGDAADGGVGMTAREIELERKRILVEGEHGVKFWDRVTDADVEAAIEGTAYGDLVALLRSNMTPELPIAATLPKAMVMAGAAMSGSAIPDPNGVLGNPDGFDDEDEDWGVQKPGDINNYKVKKRGIGLAKVRIMSTADGQGCNIYALGVADSGAGKDIGNTLTELMSERGLLIGSGCTAEGLMDALMYKPNGVLEISELKPYITAGNYQSTVTNLLTDLYAKGCFHMENSHRSRGRKRDAAYAMPSVYACIQPGVLNRLFQQELVDSGFWNRFVVAGWDIVPRRPNRVPPEQAALLKNNAREALTRFSMVQGDIEVPPCYLHDLYMRFYNELKDDKPMLSSAWRLINQPAPRIALGLSVKRNSPMTPWTPVITDEEWKKTETIITWLFAHAIRYNTGGMGDKRQQEMEDLMTRVLTKIKSAGNAGITMREIHHSLGRRKGSSAEMRAQCVRELENRGQITVRRQDTTYTGAERSPRYVAF